ncbi:hypothetical protein MCEMIEM13_01811 [Comamonadaceae bacterium]
MSSNLSHFVNFPLQEAIRLAPSDPKKAEEVLVRAARLMRAREVLPHDLLDYLAAAFEAVAAESEDMKPKELTYRLNLTARNKRPSSVQWIEAHRLLGEHEGLPKSEIIKKIIRKYKVSRSHAMKIYNEAEQAQLISDRVSREEWTDEDMPSASPFNRHAAWRSFAKFMRQYTQPRQRRLF